LGKQAPTTGERLRRKGHRETHPDSLQIPVTNLIVIGTSAGGQNAVVEVLRNLPADIPAAIIILYHSAVTSSFKFDEWLNKFTRLPVFVADKEQRLRDGAIFLSPPGRSVEVEKGLLQVSSDTSGTRDVTPINHLFQSAAKAYGNRVIGVILTGLLRDGTLGLRAVHEAGGLTIVQDPQEAQYADMPANAMKELPVTFCLRLGELGPALDLLARRKARLETGMAVSIRTLKERAALLARLRAQSKRNVDTYEFLSEELCDLEHDVQLIQKLLQDVLLKGAKLRGRKILDRILHDAMQITSADMGNVQLLDPISNTLRIVAQKGFKQPFLDFFAEVSPHEAAACGTALKLHEQVVVDDVTKSPIFAGTPSLRVLRDAGVRAVQSTPLITKTGHIVGMISTHYRTPRYPTEEALAGLQKMIAGSVEVIEALQLRMGTPSSDI
jgi:hypothetical protein